MAGQTRKKSSKRRQPQANSAEPRQRRLPGRPKQFDRPDVLRRAMHVFWSKGFRETSYSDLTKAMKMTAPSIYLAFGSKEKLFEEAFLLYSEEGAMGLRSLAEPASAKEGIRLMLKNVVRAFTAFEEPRGCMSIVGSMSMPAEQPELQTLLRNARQTTLTAIQKRLKVAAENGELRAAVNAADLSCLCRTIWSGLSLQILDGVPRSELFKAIDLFVELIGFTEHVC